MLHRGETSEEAWRGARPLRRRQRRGRADPDVAPSRGRIHPPDIEHRHRRQARRRRGAHRSFQTRFNERPPFALIPFSGSGSTSRRTRPL